ncbi:MAG: phosphodiester glycosidase family protein [Bacteroidales bacterium]|nr:phosphodiester glycosidase family protein [Bacteroidales bacterium]
MNYHITTGELISQLKNENIKTWFDLGLFIDRFREENELSERGRDVTNQIFSREISEGGVAFITFHFMVDGVTVETGKYAKLFEKNYPGLPVHYIAGKFLNKSESLIKRTYKKKEIKQLAGFNDWSLYHSFFLSELERGSTAYNKLIGDLWSETLKIVEKLGHYIEQNNISLLYIINVCSNPGNVSAALALVLLSEFMRIPVINNNHDFYFEGGNSRFARETEGLKKGPRDFFFTNSHLGEVFSLIEVLYPWESKYWLNVNINSTQSEILIREKGQNPARVMDIGTAVDTRIYTKIDKRRNINTFVQFEKILSRYRDQMISYSVEDVERMQLVSEHNPKPILIGNKTGPVNKFISENIIFLQPTRIIARKRIELGFNLLLKMFENQMMNTRFETTPHLKITLLISGPIADGHYNYYKKIIKRFRQLLSVVPEYYRNRVYLALLLGELDRASFRKQFSNPAEIPELYNISSLVLLPSKTEGRGLPIIEATACGTPIFCRRYEPEEVYSEVIGEHLGENERLRVYEFRGKKINKQIVSDIIERVFFPHKFTEDTKHNKRVVEKRYSLNSLNNNMKKILQCLQSQLQYESVEREMVKEAFAEYRKALSFRNKDLDYLMRCENRQYLAGYGKLSYMLMLKSLIDPSFFREEQQLVRGMIFYFAKEIIKSRANIEKIPEKKTETFFNAVHQIFLLREGETSIRHDHSMSYRHRNIYYYPYQDYTFQELTGIVNLLFLKIIEPLSQVKVDLSPQFFTDWNLALLQLTASNYLAIDDRGKLIEKLHANLPIAYFPGEYIMYELEFFALQALRSRLQLPIEEEVSREILVKKAKTIAPVYIFAQEKKLGKQLNKKEIINYIKAGNSEELKLLFEYELVKIISTNQLCVGIHFEQLGEEPLRILRDIREKGGFLLSNRRHAALMTDIVNIDRFHIGRVRRKFAANIMGIPMGSGYIQYVPAGLRTTLSYPSPVQTAIDFDHALKSKEYKTAVKKLGEEKVMELLVRDAEKRGSPIMHVIGKLPGAMDEDKDVNYQYLSGLYEDGNPYSGVIARLNTKRQTWQFRVLSSYDKPKTVSELAGEFEKETGISAGIGWNGGYILNPELVGKLGLPESYIGSPLGLLIMEGHCICPPLFNKPALLVNSEGNIDIQRVNCTKGITIEGEGWQYELKNTNYNLKHPGEKIAYYDLMYEEEQIEGNGRVIVRLSGNNIKQVMISNTGEKVPLIPVGITLSFPPSMFPGNLKKDEKVKIIVPGFEHVVHAVEAGPLLVAEGREVLNMKAEGWTTKKSIDTQAARLDYLDMRGPKIAVGMDDSGELAVLTVNGRIRESTGATHREMAKIMMEQGIDKAMGFDPGGSSTLVVKGKTLNISPYNHKYEYNNYALPPEPRAVSNALIGYLVSVHKVR